MLYDILFSIRINIYTTNKNIDIKLYDIFQERHLK